MIKDISPGFAIAGLICLISCGPHPPPAQDLQQLQRTQTITVVATGHGIAKLDVHIHNLTSATTHVRIPAGTSFVARRDSTQNMVSTDESTVVVGAGLIVVRTINAACANVAKAIPSSTDGFDVGLTDKNMERLAPQLVHVSNPDVRQAAVWIAADDATYEGLTTLVRPMARPDGTPLSFPSSRIDVCKTVQAMKICDDAGIDISGRRIWNTREGLLIGLLRERGCGVNANRDSPFITAQQDSLVVWLRRRSGRVAETWEDPAAWRRLRANMSRDEIREILGHPTGVEETAEIKWHYGGPYGGAVFFTRKGLLIRWREPGL